MANMIQRDVIPPSNTLGWTVVILDVLLLFLSACALGVRVNSRHLQRHSLCLNDYLAILAWLFSAGLVSTAVLGVAEGAGRHMQDVNPVNIPNMLRGYTAAVLTWIAANTAIKCSILHFYITLFRPSRVFHSVGLCVMGLVVIFGMSVLLSTVLNCRPFDRIWNPTLSGHCGSISGQILATNIVNVIIDLIILVLPMPITWSLQMAQRRKLALTFTFGMGLIVCVITVIRIALSNQLNVLDFPYHLARIAIVTDLEPLLGIIIACLPLFPPTLRALRRSRQGTTAHKSSPSGRTGLLPRSSKSSGFRRHDDAFPLTDIERSVTDVYAGTPRNDLTSLHDGTSVSTEQVRRLPEIKVKKGWEVKS